MKKVLVVGFTDNPGGIENVIMNYYRNFDRNKIQLDFLYSTDSISFEKEINELGGKTYKIEAKHSNPIKYKKSIKSFFKNNSKNYSAIWVNFCNITNMDYLKLAKKYGIECRIIHAHNSKNMGSFIKGLLHRIYKLFLPLYATDYWSCSNEASNWFYSKKIISSKKYLIINNAIDVDKFSFNNNIREIVRENNNWNDKIIIGNVGRLHFQKNQLFALDIFKEFKKLHDKSILVLVGDGEDKKMLIDRTKELKLEDSVMFLGLRNDVPDLLCGFDISLFPSLFEGLSLSLIESQCSKLLTFASNTVSPDTKVSDYIYFLDLSADAKEWAKLMLEKYQNFDRNSAVNNINEKGFNISFEAKKLEKIFLK